MLKVRRPKKSKLQIFGIQKLQNLLFFKQAKSVDIAERLPEQCE